MANKEQNIDLFELSAKKLSGNITAEENLILDNMLQKSENMSEFIALSKIWNESNSELLNIDVNKEWNLISGKTINKNRFNLKPLLKIAAILVTGFVLLGGVYKLSKTEKIYTAGNHPIEFELPDGSNVTLNKNSNLKFEKSILSFSREVKLKGEAFFEVKKSKGKTFIVSTNHTSVKVLGTSFSVKAYDTMPSVKVTVKTGLVEVSDKDNAKNKVLLKKGEKAEFEKKNRKIEKSVLISENHLSWKTKKLEFNNSKLSDVITELSEFYEKEFVLNNKDLNDVRITTSFNNNGIEEVLEVLELTLGISTELKGGKVYLYKNQ